MNLNKVYYDIDGNERNILQLVRLEPEWAAKMIQSRETEIDNAFHYHDEYISRLESDRKEMLEALIFVYRNVNICSDDPEACLLCKVQPVIERATGKTIEEVLK